MKKIISICACVFALAVSAEPYYAIVNTVAYGKDATPGDANAGYYSGYLCTVESASTYFGGKTSAADLTSYVSANYATVLASLGSATTANGVLKLAPDTEGYTTGQYAVAAYSAAALGSEYLAILLYNDGKNQAFRAFDWNNAEGNAPIGSVAFDDGGNSAANPAGGYGAWTAATVPEPTSGLLLLLGMAGFALRRKRL